VSDVRGGLEVLGIFAADLHISETPPVARSVEPDWFAAMQRPLEHLSMFQHDLYMNTGLVPPIFYVGDIFHKWNPSPEAINFAIDYLPKGHAIAGNHDLPNHRIEDIGRSAYYTLVKHGVITNMHSGRAYQFPSLTVIGSPWGCPLFNPPKAPEHHKIVTIIHDYVWIAGREHPGAPSEKHASEFAKKLVGYDAAFFGDNHACFETPVHRQDDKFTHIVNCGCLIPRRSPERKYKPTVWLLMSDGSVRPHQLDTSLDKWTDVEEVAEKVLTDENGVREFVEMLRRSETARIDFLATLKAILTDRKGKVPLEVRNAVFELLEASETV
jgi:hypothetical protein